MGPPTEGTAFYRNNNGSQSAAIRHDDNDDQHQRHLSFSTSQNGLVGQNSTSNHCASCSHGFKNWLNQKVICRSCQTYVHRSCTQELKTPGERKYRRCLRCQQSAVMPPNKNSGNEYKFASTLRSALDKTTTMATRSLSPPLRWSLGSYHHRCSRTPPRSRGRKAAPVAQYSPPQYSHSLSLTMATIQSRETRGIDNGGAALEEAGAALDRAAAAAATAVTVSGKETGTTESEEAVHNGVSATIFSARASSPTPPSSSSSAAAAAAVESDCGSDLKKYFASPEHDQARATAEPSVSESSVTGKLAEERESRRFQRSRSTRPIFAPSPSGPARGEDNLHSNQGESPGAAVEITRSTALQRLLFSQALDGRHQTPTGSRRNAGGEVSTGTTATVYGTQAQIPEARTEYDDGYWIGAGVTGSDVEREQQASASMPRHSSREAVGTDGVAVAQAMPTPMPPLPCKNAKMASRPRPSLRYGSDHAKNVEDDKEEKDHSGGCVTEAAKSAGWKHATVVETGHRTVSRQQGLDDDQPGVKYVGFVTPHPTTSLPPSSKRLGSVPINAHDTRTGAATGPRTRAATTTRAEKSSLSSAPSTPTIITSTSDGRAFEASAQARIAGKLAVRVREREREREIDEKKRKVRVNLRVGTAFAMVGAMAACGVAGVAVGVATLFKKH